MKRSIITLPDENFMKIQNIVIEQKKSGDRKASMNRIMNEAIEMYLKKIDEPIENYVSYLKHEFNLKENEHDKRN